MKSFRLPLLAASLLALLPACARAAVIWNESTNGNFSADQTAPTQLALTAGQNSIVGSVGATAVIPNKQDWVTITIPQGDVLSSLILASFVSTDTQGFIGVQAGTSFIGNAGTAPPYLGYTHWGTAATNGALPPTNLVGQDLLALMGNTTLAAGSQGFTPPLAAGSYTFLIQQSGTLTSYQLDFNVTAAPEPASAALLLAALLLFPWHRRPADAGGLRNASTMLNWPPWPKPKSSKASRPMARRPFRSLLTVTESTTRASSSASRPITANHGSAIFSPGPAFLLRI